MHLMYMYIYIYKLATSFVPTYAHVYIRVSCIMMANTQQQGYAPYITYAYTCYYIVVILIYVSITVNFMCMQHVYIAT